MRVIVTRPQAQAEPLLNALRAQGFEPIACPVIATEPLDDGPIDVTGYDWVIVTSANGAAELGARHIGVLPRVAAVGELTAAALEANGVAVEFIPTLASQEGLLADELPADFRAVYRTVELTPVPPDGDLVLLASPSAAAAWAKLGSTLPAITIGPQTTAAALDAQLTVVAEADTQNVAGLVDSAAAWRASLRS
jgi:uroporphyrinogen-III synthase